MNYFYQSNQQPAAQPDPFVQLEEGLRGAQNAHQIKVDRIKELEQELDSEKEKSEQQESRYTIRIVELEKEITVLKTTQNTQGNLNVNLTK